MALTAKQQAFVREYLVDKNATAAAKRAGYSGKTARWIGHENLTKPHIAAAVDEALTEIERKAIADAREARETLTRILRQELTEDTIAGKDPVRFETRPNAASIIRAVEALAKLEGWTSSESGAGLGELDAIAEALREPRRVN